MEYYGVNDFEFVFSAHFHVQKDWYPHPKLKLYQYFYGGGLRFFDDDLDHVWRGYFNDSDKGLDMDEINKFELFDEDIFDLLKCDEIYKKWYLSIERSMSKRLDTTNENK